MAVTRILSLVLRNTWHYVIIRYSYGELPKFVLRGSYEAALRKGVTTALDMCTFTLSLYRVSQKKETRFISEIHIFTATQILIKLYVSSRAFSLLSLIFDTKHMNIGVDISMHVRIRTEKERLFKIDLRRIMVLI